MLGLRTSPAARDVSRRVSHLEAGRASLVCSATPIGRNHQKRDVLLAGLTCVLSLNLSQPATAYTGLDYKQEMARRRKKIPESEFREGPSGLKLYDIIEGTGAEVQTGQRVAVHYDVKFRNVTFITSRQGLGVTGGTPVGFNVGTPYGESGSTLPGIDLGIRGMRVGGLRRLLVPPELAYGDKGVGEIPGGATLTVDLEVLSIKTSPLGYRTKLVEG
ncbi:FKBP-type peptidyl-prolyl cis-trans isomerase [Haematococcus lacustris]